jgi:hypothetical protein
LAATAFLVFYRFKAMSKEQAERAKGEWQNIKIKNSLPSGIELVGEYIHEWGIEYNGLLLFDADSADSFLDWWSKFKDTIRWYVEQTHTATARRRQVI